MTGRIDVVWERAVFNTQSTSNPRAKTALISNAAKHFRRFSYLVHITITSPVVLGDLIQFTT